MKSKNENIGSVAVITVVTPMTFLRLDIVATFLIVGLTAFTTMGVLVDIGIREYVFQGGSGCYRK